jgi:hypothetical protein
MAKSLLVEWFVIRTGLLVFRQDRRGVETSIGRFTWQEVAEAV